MKKTMIVVAVFAGCIASFLANAQNMPVEDSKTPVFGEFGIGGGQTLFFGDMQARLQQSYGGTFNPSIGNNLMMGFYVAPSGWNGLGIGSRIKGTFGTSVNGDNGDRYIFNYYNLGVSAKYYPFTKEFNRGLYGRASMGFGQFTSKRMNEDTKLYRHQYAIGSSLMGGVGYTKRFNRYAISVEVEFDYSSRNGTIDGIGDARYQSGQLGANILFSF